MNLSDVKQVIMFTNDGDKVNAAHCYNVKKIKSKEQEQIKLHQQILENSSELKSFSDTVDKAKKKPSNKKDILSKSSAMVDLHSDLKNPSSKKASATKKKKAKKGIQHFSEPPDQTAPEEESSLPSIKKRKQYKEDIQ